MARVAFVRRLVTVLVAGALVSALFAVGPAATVGPASAGISNRYGYVATAPCRVANTVPGSPLAASGPGATRTFQISGSGAAFAAQGGKANGCGVPDTAALVELAVTTVDPAGAGYLRAYPAGASEPSAVLNSFASGVPVTTTAPLLLGTGGALAMTVHGASTDVVVEVLGYFSTTTPVRFTAITPCRVLSTTAGSPLAAGEGRDVQVGGAGAVFAAQGGKPGGCGVPDDAEGAEVVVTAVGPTGNGYTRVRPADQVGDGATVLNYRSGRSITNASIVPFSAGAGVDVTLQNFGGSSDYVIDVVGYWSAGGLGSYVPAVTPCRALDTRPAGGAVPAGGVRALVVGGTFDVVPSQGQAMDQLACGVWDGRPGVVASVTVVDPAGAGYLRAWPTGVAPPNATFMNFADGESMTATGTLSLSLSGQRDLVAKVFGGTADLVVDVRGHYERAFGPAGVVDDVAPGLVHTCALVLSDAPRGNTVRCVGRNASGQLGDGTTTDRLVPAAVTTPTSPDPVPINSVHVLAAGYSHSCTLSNGGRSVQCWGSNSAGQLGNGTKVNALRTVTPSFGLSGPVVVSPGGSSTCAVLATLSVKCWGLGTGGQLGNGGTASSSLPVLVTGLNGLAADVTVGAGHACALLRAGTVRCWGSNTFGQLGNGGTASSTVPVDVPGLTGVVDVAAGTFHTCALLAGGSLRCWGKGTSGQLGNGANANSSTPVAVTGLTDATALGAGGAHTCASTAAAVVRCWGQNNKGQLGDGSNVNRPSPVTASVSFGQFAVPLGSVTGVGVGFDATCVTRADGGVRCWGNNSAGQLGDGTTLNRSRPVAAFAP